jgi:hypothetical protein
MFYRFATIAILAMILTTIAFAQENLTNETTELPRPWILPDSPFYGLKRWIERAQEMFMFREAIKAQFHLRLAQLRLAELKAMQEKNKLERYENLINEYENEINKSEVHYQNALKKGEAIATGLMQALNATAKHLLVLERVKNQTCERAPNSTTCMKMIFVIQRASEGNIRIVQLIQERYQEILNQTNKTVCAQVITYAINPSTKNCVEFPTPCDVPRGWKIVENCSST